MWSILDRYASGREVRHDFANAEEAIKMLMTVQYVASIAPGTIVSATVINPQREEIAKWSAQ